MEGWRVVECCGGDDADSRLDRRDWRGGDAVALGESEALGLWLERRHWGSEWGGIDRVRQGRLISGAEM